MGEEPTREGAYYLCFLPPPFAYAFAAALPITQEDTPLLSIADAQRKIASNDPSLLEAAPTTPTNAIDSLVQPGSPLPNGSGLRQLIPRYSRARPDDRERDTSTPSPTHATQTPATLPPPNAPQSTVAYLADRPSNSRASEALPPPVRGGKRKEAISGAAQGESQQPPTLDANARKKKRPRTIIDVDELDAMGLLDNVPGAGSRRPRTPPRAANPVRRPVPASSSGGQADRAYEGRRAEAKAEIREIIRDVDASLATASADLASANARWRRARGLLKGLEREI